MDSLAPTGGIGNTQDSSTVEVFLQRWEASGAAERANYALFLTELCDVLGVTRPEPTRPDDSENAYVFERSVTFRNPDGSTNPGRIDLYKRGCFVLEAKQGSDKAEPSGKLAMPKAKKRGTAVRGTAGWDEAMLAARGQAEQYARALPASEPMPPFLVVLDVGHTIELYADFTRQGRTYIPYPDPRSHRIKLRDLADETTRERLRLVWTDPQALDPSRITAKVTRDVAARLAALAKSLEQSGQAPEAVAQFLMRCLFTFFAEDVGLLPKDSFTDLLRSLKGQASVFPEMAASLWQSMKTGGFSPVLRRNVLHFNGGLFESAEALPVTEDQLALLTEAGEREWRDVEPAIFGTLLERALDPIERHKLGAHYTPRAYVERLVMPTIIEPLREEWTDVQTAAIALANEGKVSEAREEVKIFLRKLCDTVVLDPACGTGNFLYVTLEHMKRLEGEVWDTLRGLGETQTFEGFGLSVDPHQFLGIEINPRAAAIADLVLWIGYLQWHYRTAGNHAPSEPIIRAYHNIEHRDAVLDYERIEPVLDESRNPVTRWDGRTMKRHPTTGEEVPDETARTPVAHYINPRMATWPASDYIIGNPPFLGQQRMRIRLGDGYVDAIRAAHPDVPSTSDYVMHWWNFAAKLVQRDSAKRFGFVTTNKITQPLNQKVVLPYLEGKDTLSILFGIPDHPWSDDHESADVRIAMSVAEHSERSGVILSVVRELPSEEGLPIIEFEEKSGRINPDLSIGTDMRPCIPLSANLGLAIKGFELGSQGFLVPREEGDSWLAVTPSLHQILKPYMNGDDLKDGKWYRYVIDFHGFNEAASRAFVKPYQHVYDRVVADRATNREQRVIRDWWLFRRSGAKLRTALRGLHRFIGTTRTAKFRVFQFLPANLTAESKIVVVASGESWLLGILSSRIHVTFATRIGGWLGVGNDPTYNHTDCFNKFPFPSLSAKQRATIGQLAEDLDSHRKARLSEHPSLTITDIYNVLEKLRASETLEPEERSIHERGLVSVLKQIHDDLDSAVFDAYGWPHDLTDDEILARLVALNAERAADEARGIIHWLRPEFQHPSGNRAAVQTNLLPTTADEPEPDGGPLKPAKRSPWPKSLPEQVQAVRSALSAHPSGLTPEQLARTFLRARTDRVSELLATLASLGQARPLGDGRFVRS